MSKGVKSWYDNRRRIQASKWFKICDDSHSLPLAQFPQTHEGEKILRSIYNLPTPLAGGQKKIICGANEFFSGVGMIFFDPVSNFQCATPRGLIRLLTVGCNFPQIAPLVDAILRRVARPLPHSVLYQRKALGATFAMVDPAFSISRIFKPYFCIS